MSFEECLGRTPDGALTLCGHDVRELVARRGSPLLVILEPVVRDNCRAYREAFARHYPRSRTHYAAKAFMTTGFCRLIDETGLGLDVVSEGELATALAVGFPAERILLHGNAKTLRDLEQALAHGVGRIVIDNLEEIDRLARLAAGRGVRAEVLVRVTPGIDAHTHRFVQTGQVDSKFGFNLGGGLAEAAVRRVLASPSLRLAGLHCHIGSQILETAPFAAAARVMMEFYARLQREAGAPLGELDMGGGLGIRYADEDAPPAIEDHVRVLAQAVLAAADEFGVAPPVLLNEPGRSIVGRAGVTLYAVQSTKQISGVRNYASVDGGMSDNPRYALYAARHPMLAATRLDEPADGLWSISGRCCESGDMLIHDVAMPPLREGDLLAVLSAGAYTHSMAGHYNRLPLPSVVLVAPGREALLAERESSADLLRQDRVPAWLARGSS